MKPDPLPLEQLYHLRKAVNRLVDLLVAGTTAPRLDNQAPVDVIDGASQLRIAVDLPGVAASDLEVEVRDRVLTIRATTRRSSLAPEARRYHLMERTAGPVSAVVELPEPVRPDRASARLANGVLRIILPTIDDQRHRAHSIPVVEEVSTRD